MVEARPTVNSAAANTNKGLSAELEAAINVRVADVYAHWKATCTPEMDAKDQEELQRVKIDAVYRMEKIQKLLSGFNEADVDRDHLLSLDEYKVWYQGTVEEQKAEGKFADERESQAVLNFAIMNQVNPDKDGIAIADFLKVMRVWSIEWQRLKAAPGQ